MQLRSNRDDLNIYLPSNDLVGIVVSNKQSLHQQRGWNAFLCLNELLSSRGLNIFPLPVGIHRDSIKLSVTFAFELVNNTEIVRFDQIISPSLATYLRKIPMVIHTWCKQLCNAYQSLLRCSTGSLMKPIDVMSDIFIRDTGLLLIGNVSFDSILPKNKLRYKYELLSMICDMLSNALCTSRVVKVALQYLR